MGLIRHVVRPGQCCSSLAQHYGLPSWQTIYTHSANAELRAKRPEGNVIYPGDVVMVPEIEIKEDSAPTEQRHRYRMLLEPTMLRIVLADMDDEPLRNHRYALHMDGGQVREGVTDGDGLLEEAIPAELTNATLIFEIEDEEDISFQCSIPLDVGHLNPISEDVGVQERLSNLGYRCGAYDGDHGEKTQDALKRFQEDKGLDVTGEADDATRQKLEDLHGS